MFNWWPTGLRDNSPREELARREERADRDVHLFGTMRERLRKGERVPGVLLTDESSIARGRAEIAVNEGQPDKIRRNK